MPEAKVTMHIRPVNGIASIIDIHGELNAFAEKILMDSTQPPARLPRERLC